MTRDYRILEWRIARTNASSVVRSSAPMTPDLNAIVYRLSTSDKFKNKNKKGLLEYMVIWVYLLLLDLSSLHE